MTRRYRDPYFMPPADIQGAEAKAYEQEIVSLLREEMMRWSGPVTFEAIELRGERPDTEIIFRYTDRRHPGQRFVDRTLLWRDPTYGCWPCNDSPESTHELDSAVSVSAAIGSAWYAHELESVPGHGAGD